MILTGWLKAAALLSAVMAVPALQDQGEAPRRGRVAQELRAAQENYAKARRFGQTFRGQGGEYRFQVMPDQYSQLLTLVEPPVLGLVLQPVPEVLRAHLDLDEGQGLVVAEVAEGSPAAEAGIEKHDVLTAVGGEPISEAADLSRAVQEADGSLTLTRLRKGQEQEIEVTLPEGGDQPERTYYLGIQISGLDEEKREALKLDQDQEGVVVLGVVEGSPAAEVDLKAEDLLIELDEKQIANPEELLAEIQEIGDAQVELKFLREGEEQVVEITPRPRPEDQAAPVVVQGQPLQERAFQFFGPGVVVTPEGDAGHTLRFAPGFRGAPGQPPVLFWQGQQQQNDLALKLDELTRQIKELREQIEALKKSGDRRDR